MHDLNELSEVFQLIAEGAEKANNRALSRQLRAQILCPTIGFTKLAFDTRRINQETEYNPRRGLQNYQRSQQFVSENMAQKVNNFAKLRKVVNELREKYGKEPEWQDSNARILLSTLDKGLRISQQDGDFTDNQPGMGSLDYIEELLHVRYRLGFDQLTSLGEAELAQIILSRDESIAHKNLLPLTSKADMAYHNQDGLLEKLFREVHATSDNPDTEKTITITIRDRIVK